MISDEWIWEIIVFILCLTRPHESCSCTVRYQREGYGALDKTLYQRAQTKVNHYLNLSLDEPGL